jgi:2-hydroxy-4-carboxymuconate semialdehyde hemiacetal dehydrogenase
MSIRVALIGGGGVGSIHAGQLAAEAGVELASVFSPHREMATQFASTYGIKQVSATLAGAISLADMAIVCSPSPLHFEQASECLKMGVHTLVEMPPCETLADAEELARLAEKHGVRLGCAHTSRYLVPYVRIAASIRKSELGPIQTVSYVRHHKLRERAWVDDALLHHAAHPIDLLIHWFGGILPRGCVALPQVRNAQSVSLLAKLQNGAPATVSVTYASHLPHVRMLIVGERHTIETDGFSYIRSDLANLQFDGQEQATYERAIHDQDVEFLRACRGERNGVKWQEAVELLKTVNRFQELGSS